MKIPQQIALIGFPCSGKSTLGKALAQYLNYAWQDSDQALQTETGQSPEEIILTQGQAAFRKLEHQWIQDWQPPKKLVLSTGGGLPCFQNNLSLLKEKAWTIYLNPDYLSLKKRLYHEPAHTLTHIYSSAELEKLYRDRDKIYQNAHFSFQPTENNQQNVHLILKQFA